MEKSKITDEKTVENAKMVLLFKSKKGQFADILGGIQRVFSWFLTTAPKPLLYVIFLLFILFISSIFGFFLNATGNFCDTAGNEYSTGFFSLFTNVGLLSNMPANEDLDSTELDPEKTDVSDSSLLDCTEYWVGMDRILDNGTRVNLVEGWYFHDTGRCTNCENVVKVVGSEGLSEGYCVDDILYPKSHEEKSWLGKMTCGKRYGACAIPEGYYYNRATNKFVCDNVLCQTNGSANAVGQLWNLKLKEAGARLRETVPDNDRSYKNVIDIRCDVGDVNPHMRLMGIEIFDYKLWLVLFVLALVIWALTSIKHR